MRHIGNTLGTYLDHEKSYLTLGIMTMAKILVHLDTREGLEEAITLRWKQFVRIQTLGYEGVP